MAPFGQAVEQNPTQSNSSPTDASARLRDSALPQPPSGPLPPKVEPPKELEPSEMLGRFFENQNLIEKTVGLNSPEMFLNLELWAAYDQKTGDFAHAEAHLKQASEINKVLNDEKLQALLIEDYSKLHAAEGKPKDPSVPQQAKTIAERAKAERFFSTSAASGASPQHMALETGALAISYAKTGEMDKADRLYNLSSKLYQDYAPQDPAFGELQQQYAKIKKGLGAAETPAGLNSQGDNLPAPTDHPSPADQPQPKDPATDQPTQPGVSPTFVPDEMGVWNAMDKATVPVGDTPASTDAGIPELALSEMAAQAADQGTPPSLGTDQSTETSSNVIVPSGSGDSSLPAKDDQPRLTDTKNDTHDDYEREQNLMRNLSIASAAFGAGSPEVAEVAAALGTLYYSRTPPQDEQALSFMNQATQILEHTPNPGQTLPSALMQKARVLERMGQLDQSAEAERQSTYYSKSSFVQEELKWWINSAHMPVSPSSILGDSAEAANLNGDTRRADLLYREAISNYEVHLHESTPQNPDVYRRYAAFLKEHGDAAGAAQYEALDRSDK